MSRIIKFRAWDTQHKVMLESVTVYAASDHLGIDLDEASAHYTEDQLEGSDGHIYVGDDWIFIMNGFELMQFVGLLDKNGKKIYEGDILMDQYEDIQPETWEEEAGTITVKIYYAVVFKDGAFGWIGRFTGQFFSFHDLPVPEMEVIGNVYQHPELLKQTI
jgi:uncharacterized phage protein (TIGR01671 family)